MFQRARFVAGVKARQQVVGARDSLALRADSVFRRFDRSDAPGCVLGVYQDGRVRYARGYGMASLELGIALSPRSVLDVGSISKQFTAMAICILADEGKLVLDDPLAKHLAVPDAWRDITIRHLLTHTSGLGDYPEDFSLQRDYTEDELVKFAASRPLVFPGT